MTGDRDFIRHTEQAQNRSAGRRARDESRDSGYRKAAQLLILIGEDAATRVLCHLDADEVEGITREIARIGTISDLQASSILQEFGYMARAGLGTAHGGAEQARDMLERALGSQEAERVLDRIKNRIGTSFSFLGDLDPNQVATTLREESVIVVATILSQLEPQQAASILTCLSEDRRVAVAQRIARMTLLSPDALHRIQTVLVDRVRTQERFLTHAVDGSGTLRDIMRHMSATDGRRIVSHIEVVDPDLALTINKGLFTLDLVLQIRKRDLHAVLVDVADRELALILKGKDADIREALLGAVSSRRRLLIDEEYQALGAVPRTEVDRVTDDFLADLRRRWEAGELVLIDRDEEIVG